MAANVGGGAPIALPDPAPVEGGEGKKESDFPCRTATDPFLVVGIETTIASPFIGLTVSIGRVIQRNSGFSAKFISIGPAFGVEGSAQILSGMLMRPDGFSANFQGQVPSIVGAVGISGALNFDFFAGPFTDSGITAGPSIGAGLSIAPVITVLFEEQCEGQPHL